MEKNLKDVFSTSMEIDINGEKYRIKPITLGALAAFQKWCDTERQAEMINLYKLTGTKIDIKEILAIKTDEVYWNEKMASIEGVSHLFYDSIQKNNKDIPSIEEVSDYLTIENFEKVSTFLFAEFLKNAEPIKPKNVKAKSPKKK